ncbi:putative nuclease HARBI1 [Armigeres subalbatus]|uniref:putative nuclease HARBI1 n=1 Tax=Armigeres subalbatus TaxID=124917 RepID=UPI002ED1111C
MENLDIHGMSSSDTDSEDEFYSFLDAACYIPEEPKKRRTRERHDFFAMYDDSDFEARFRLTKEMSRELAGLLESSLDHSTARNMPVPVNIQVLLALRYYATGSFETVVGDLEGIHQTTVGRIVKKVSHAIAALADRFIKMPSEEEWQETNTKFFRLGGIPRTIGVIDGISTFYVIHFPRKYTGRIFNFENHVSRRMVEFFFHIIFIKIKGKPSSFYGFIGCHIPIISPGGDNAEIFRNRKGWFSINTMAVCDADMKIRNIVARWPGSTHDQTVFSLSQLRAEFESGMYHHNIILGDSGYRCTPYLITPLLNPTTGPEKSFQKGFIRTRNIVERVFGAWKRRFPIIGMKIRSNVEDALVTIVATAVLHNVCINTRMPPAVQHEEFVQPDEHFDAPQMNNQMTRNNIIANYFG